MNNRLCLLNSNVCPPDGFRYTFPEDGYVVNEWTYDAWVQSALNHARANHLTEPTGETMQEQMCLILPPGWCRYDDPNRPRVMPGMTWDDIAGGLTTFQKWVAQGQPFVPQKEAERRAMICSRCYLNLPVTGCAGCHAAVKMVVGNVSTKHDVYLRACGVCKCLLRAKVHFPLSTLDMNDERAQQMYPDHCWLKKGGLNYGG